MERKIMNLVEIYREDAESTEGTEGTEKEA
jgi:hypothetical protein